MTEPTNIKVKKIILASSKTYVFSFLLLLILVGIHESGKFAAASFLVGEYKPISSSVQRTLMLGDGASNFSAKNSSNKRRQQKQIQSIWGDDSPIVCYAMTGRQQKHKFGYNKDKKNVNKRKRSKAFQIPNIKQNDTLNTILQQCNFDGRLVKINDYNLPTVAEVHANGKWNLCIITGFKVPSSVMASSSVSDSLGKEKENKLHSFKLEISSPLIKVILIDKDVNYHDQTVIDKYSCVVDVGQITYIWNHKLFHEQRESWNDMAMTLSKHMSSIQSSLQKLPVNQIETSMQHLYEKCVDVGDKRFPNNNNRNGSGLTKKDISKISSSIIPSERGQHLDQILRRGLKAGLNSGEKTRLIDSEVAASSIMGGGKRAEKSNPTASLLVGATLLSRDAELGGRFKRSGCIFVAAQYHNKEEKDELSVQEISLLNGGWAAVDESVKAGTEARKFVERRGNSSENGKGNNNVNFTSADERILYRLECFAMGEILKKDDGSQQLEVDLRETLSAMNLPLTPKGAQLALIQSGKWSTAKNNNKKGGKNTPFEPWTNEVLESARMLTEREEKRKKQMCSKFVKSPSKSIEGRTNLITLPTVCVDAKRASFRDDAIGVRPRSSTGRKVIEAASKWEILVHITDVSDLYSPEILRPTNDSFDFSLLRKAAESRGTSRYDLPFGPLHLMPPIALDALALATKGVNGKSNRPPVNRCVTLWAYIDERNGKLLDAGLERTLISAPIALTFQSASAILAGDVEIDSASMKKAKAVLSVVERNLSIWKENRLKSDKAAAKRESRLQVKEMIAKEMIQKQDMRDDGANGSFQRTRGHRLVDQSLDLYGSTLSKLLQKKNAPIPRASGSTKDRDGRVGTAPLRRYIDGIVQRQALSVLCSYGGSPMTQKDCDKANRLVNDATKRNNQNNNAASSKRSKTLKMLEAHLSAIGNSNQHIVPALCTGKQNEVVISGLGITVKCGGVKGSLKGGERVLVEITELNSEKGILKVHLSD